MSREVLIRDLQAKGEEQIAALWREAREQAEEFRRRAEERLAAEGDRCSLEARTAGQAVRRKHLVAAQRRSAAVVTLAEQEVADRLRGLASEALPRLTGTDRAGLFSRLAAEVPPGDWGEARVNPADADAAAKLFPGAKIRPDASVSGGLDLTSRDGRITIDNTLEKRLERIWSRLAPELLREVANDAEAG